LNLASSTTSLIGCTPSSLDTVKFAEYRRECGLINHEVYSSLYNTPGT